VPRLSRSIPALIAALVAGCSPRAPAPPTSSVTPSTNAVNAVATPAEPTADPSAILAALDRRVSVDFDDLPLRQAIAELSRQADVPIKVDWDGIAQVRVPTGNPPRAWADRVLVSLRQQDVTLDSVLRDIAVLNDLAIDARWDRLALTLRGDASQSRTSVVFPLPPSLLNRDRGFDEASIAQIIRWTVPDGDWGTVSSQVYIEPLPGALLVVQTPYVQWRIGHVLSGLRAVAERGEIWPADPWNGPVKNYSLLGLYPLPDDLRGLPGDPDPAVLTALAGHVTLAPHRAISPGHQFFVIPGGFGVVESKSTHRSVRDVLQRLMQGTDPTNVVVDYDLHVATELRAALQRQVTLDARDQPLRDVIRQMLANERLDAVRIIEHAHALRLLDAMITIRLRGLTLASALDALCWGRDLTWSAAGNELQFATLRDAPAIIQTSYHRLSLPVGRSMLNEPEWHMVQLLRQAYCVGPWDYNGVSGARIDAVPHGLLMTHTFPEQRRLHEFLRTFAHATGEISGKAPARLPECDSNIERALNQPIFVDGRGQPLGAFLDCVAIELQSNIQPYLRPATNAWDTPLGTEATAAFGLPLADALDVVLRPHGLEWVASGEVIFVGETIAATDPRAYAIDRWLMPDGPLREEELLAILHDLENCGRLLTPDPVVLSRVLLATRDHRSHRRLQKLLTNEGGCFDRLLTLRQKAAGPDAVATLSEALSDRSGLVRRLALMWLADRGTAAETAINHILPCLNDPDRDVRIAAVAAIDAIGLKGSDAASGLARSLVGSDWLVAWEASAVLVRHGPDSAAALPELAELIPTVTDVDSQTRLIDILRAIGPASFPVLADHLHHADWLLIDGCLILAEHPDTALAFVPQLTAALSEPLTDQEADSIYSLLATLGPPAEAAVPALIEAVQRPGAHRPAACVALGSIARQPDTVVPVLIACAHDRSNPDLRRAACQSLGWFGADAAEALDLLDQIRHERPATFVQQAAEHAWRAVRQDLSRKGLPRPESQPANDASPATAPMEGAP
jgi:hypothetical protein